MNYFSFSAFCKISKEKNDFEITMTLCSLHHLKKYRAGYLKSLRGMYVLFFARV